LRSSNNSGSILSNSATPPSIPRTNVRFSARLASSSLTVGESPLTPAFPGVVGRARSISQCPAFGGCHVGKQQLSMNSSPRVSPGSNHDPMVPRVLAASGGELSRPPVANSVAFLSADGLEKLTPTCDRTTSTGPVSDQSRLSCVRPAVGTARTGLMRGCIDAEGSGSLDRLPTV
jgi:hypothetical protein